MIFNNATDNYFLALLAAYLGGTDAPVPPDDIAWEQMVGLAQKHRLAPMLLAALPAGAPATALSELKNQSRQRRIRTMVMTGDFQALQRAFANAEIPLVPVKGIAIAHTFYPSPTMRYFDDLDMLIPAGAATQALQILADVGYTPHPNADFPEWHHLAPHVHPKHATLVELHVDLMRRTGPGWPLTGVWARLRSGELDGKPCQMLAPVDALLYAVLHARHNLFHRLSTFIDIGYLAQAVYEAGEIELLHELATESSAIQILGHSLYELDKLFGWRPLAEQQRRFALNQRQRTRLQARVGWHSLDLTTRPNHGGPLARLQESRLTDSWGATGQYLRHLLFPPAEFVQQTYGSDQKSAGRGYGRRLLNRANVAAKQLLSR